MLFTVHIDIPTVFIFMGLESYNIGAVWSLGLKAKDRNIVFLCEYVRSHSI